MSELRQCKHKEQCVHPQAVDGWLPASADYFPVRSSHGRKGLSTQCRPCDSKMRKERHLANPDKQREADKRYRAAHPDRVQAYRERTKDERSAKKKAWKAKNRERIREVDRAYYAKNKDRLYARAKQYLADNPEAKERSRAAGRKFDRANREKKRQYRLDNLDKFKTWRKENYEQNKVAARIYVDRRRARKLSLADTLTPEQWAHALAYFGNACAVCGRTEDFWTVLALDHWIPLSADDCLSTTISPAFSLYNGADTPPLLG
jgi:hypothetical protein